MRTALLLAAGALTLAACNKPEPAAPPEALPAAAAPAPATADWSSLEALVGQFPRDSGLFETSVIGADLKALLGPKAEVLTTNTQTQSPLQKEGSVLYTSGNKAHEGGINQAYVLIDPQAKALEVGLWEEGKLTTYKTPGSAIAKPKDIVTMLENAAAP